jgi:hypothetical protein
MLFVEQGVKDFKDFNSLVRGFEYVRSKEQTTTSLNGVSEGDRSHPLV